MLSQSIPKFFHVRVGQLSFLLCSVAALLAFECIYPVAAQSPSPPSISETGGGTVILNATAATLSFAITNPNASLQLTGVGFTDTLTSGLVVATPNGLSESCGGTIRAISGSSSISIANATLPANSSCSLTIKVVGTSVGTKNNPVTVTSNEGGTGNTSTAQVVVIAMPAPTISIAFGSSSIALNASTSLAFTISNPNASPLTAVTFTDSLPSGLVVATPSGLSGSCGGGAITAVSASSSVSLVGATLAASSSCNFSIRVTGATAGVKNNTTGNNVQRKWLRCHE